MSNLVDKLVSTFTEIANDIKNLLGTVGKLNDLFSPDLALTASNADAYGIFTTLTYVRSDDSVYKTLVLSGGTAPEYTTRTLTVYDTDGTTVLYTKVFSLTYTAGRCLSVSAEALIDIEAHLLNTKPYVSVKGDDVSYYVPFVGDGAAGNKDLSIDAGITYNPSSNTLTVLGDVATPSDKRLKTNIKVIRNALSKVMHLRGVTYLRKDNGLVQAGIVAQDLQKVLPEAVTDNGKFLAVAHSNITGLFVEAIKDLARESEKQRTLIEKQAVAIKDLKAELKSLRKDNGLA